MKLFRKAKCGCVYIEVGEGGSGTQIIVENCAGSDGSVSPFFAGPSNYIQVENLVSEFVSDEEHTRIINRINELLIAGDKFETIQRLLEKRKP
jgi:hypothetical protein